jgi:hypothetical protein
MRSFIKTNPARHGRIRPHIALVAVVVSLASQLGGKANTLFSGHHDK